MMRLALGPSSTLPLLLIPSCGVMVLLVALGAASTLRSPRPWALPDCWARGPFSLASVGSGPRGLLG
eukprot:2166865-Pyramimonas_sp.AAC.1